MISIMQKHSSASSLRFSSKTKHGLSLVTALLMTDEVDLVSWDSHIKLR